MTDTTGDPFTRDLFAWQDQVLADRELTPICLHVALVIGQHVNRRTGEAWPSQIRIAEVLDASRRGVQGALDQLASRGHLRVIPAGNRRGGNRYRPLLASETAKAFHARDDAPRQPPHAHEDAHENEVHAHDGAHGDGSHAQISAGFMRTAVRPNHLKEPSDRDSISPPSDTKPKARPRAPKPSTTDAEFDAFWLQVPKAVGRADARRAYDKAITSGSVTHHEIMLGIARYAAERQGEDPKFTKHPATWLNKGCWADVPTRSTGAQQRPGGRGHRVRPEDHMLQRLEEIDDER